MADFEFTVTDNVVTVRKKPQVIASGSVNLLTAEFEFDGSWDGYSKCAVWKTSEVQVETLLSDGCCTVPWEALQSPSRDLRVGVYGVAGDVLRPTIYTGQRLNARLGAGPSDESSQPDADLCTQIMASIGDMDMLDTENKSDLVSAINEIALLGGADFQTSDITDTGGYYTTDTVEGALQEIGNWKVGFNNALTSLIDTKQPKTITDTGGYFTTDTVEAALQEIGAELSGVNTLLGNGVIS